MWGLVAVLASGAAGFLSQRRVRRRSPTRQSSNEVTMVEAATRMARHAAITAAFDVRRKAMKAFLLTSKQYAPVPMTHIAALTASFPAIFGTCFCSHLCIVSGLELFRLLIDQAIPLEPPNTNRRPVDMTTPGESVATPPGADDPEPATRSHLSGVQKSVALHVVVFGLGSVGYLMFHDRWIRGPLRGSLCVFGASPKLDHCASKERFLMGKVASLGYGGYEQIVTLAQLAHTPSNSSTALLPPQLEPETRQLIGYASDVMGLRFVIDSIEKTFGEWAKRYVKERSELRALSDKLVYPPGTEAFVPLISAPAKCAALHMGLQDIKTAVAEVKGALGSQLKLKFYVTGLVSATGFALGYELGAFKFEGL